MMVNKITNVACEYEVTISAMKGFEFKSKKTAFNIYDVAENMYELIIGGARIHFPPKAAKLSVNKSFNSNDLESSTFSLVLMGFTGDKLQVHINLPLDAAKQLNETFPELNLIDGEIHV